MQDTSQGGEVVTLPSGRQAVIRRGTGRTVLAASRMVDMSKEGPFAIMLATIACTVTVDGRELTYEDVLEMPDIDVWFLVGKSGLGKGVSSPPITLAS